MGETFLLGVGCMKGGTTWLHDYLAASPQCAAGYRKEYHVFDSIDVPDLTWMRGRILARARQDLAALEAGGTAEGGSLHQASMMADPELYFDYFAALVQQRPGARFTLDMTPNYGLLGHERLSSIRDGFARRGVRCVSVFLMRDPVERIWSQIRMQKRRRSGANPGTDEELLLSRFTDAQYAERTRYEVTLGRLDRAFDPGDVYVGFYERLFDPAELGRICGLVGIDVHEPDLDARRNASPKTEGELEESTAHAVASHFRATYEAVAERFTDVDLRTLWPSSRFVL
jgi:hypothetical protein